MSLLGSLLSKRAIDASTFPIDPTSWADVADSGAAVDKESAMKLVAVYACVTLISDAIASMPVDLYTENPDGSRTEVKPKPQWLRFPNAEMPWLYFADRSMDSLLLWGNAYWLITNRDAAGYPDELFALDPMDVSVRRDSGTKVFVHKPTGQRLTQYSALNPGGEVLHIMGHSSNGLVGLSPIEEAKQAIGSGLGIEKYGNKFFGNAAVPSGVIELPQGSSPTSEQLTAMGESVKRKANGKNAFMPIVLGNGAHWSSIQLPNDAAQFLESRSFNVAEIARAFRVPPHMIGDVERSTSWGTGIEQQGIGFVTYTLGHWIVRIENALNQMVRPGQYAKLNVSALLRGDTKGRYDAYQVAIQNGILTRNEARQLEDRKPIEGLDGVLRPLNVTDDSKPDSKTQSDTIGALVRAGFIPDSVVEAVIGGDLTKLKHSGLEPVTVKEPTSGL